MTGNFGGLDDAGEVSEVQAFDHEKTLIEPRRVNISLEEWY